SSRLCQFSTTTTAAVKRVGTHNGSFHCDEALACFILCRTLKFSNAQIIRTIEPQSLEKLDAVLDVGGVYGPTRDRYDHHQKGFDQMLAPGFTTKLSSAGLVYKHYGVEVIGKELKLDEKHSDVYRLFLAVYKNFVEAIDAVDNGINQYDTGKPPRYVNNTSLSSRVGQLNLDWVDRHQSSERENEAFQHAMTLAGNEFLEVLFHAKSWLPTQSIAMECLAARENVNSSGEIMMLTRSCPWKLHIFEVEEETKSNPSIKVIYQVPLTSVMTVAVSPDKFESRKPLRLPWRGLDNDKLSEVVGISGCDFIHMTEFIGGNQSYEGTLATAKGSLKA
ncbi:LOW QUALITY PROTEIN: UPF0160 domain-containing protein, partial [Cephalotus follicularis]